MIRDLEIQWKFTQLEKQLKRAQRDNAILKRQLYIQPIKATTFSIICNGVLNPKFFLRQLFNGDKH